jgi:hypothetical protein
MLYTCGLNLLQAQVIVAKVVQVQLPDAQLEEIEVSLEVQLTVTSTNQTNGKKS